MNKGDLVRRLNSWVKDNPWMATMLRDEIGIVTKVWKDPIFENDNLVLVLRCRSGHRTEHVNDIEKLFSCKAARAPSIICAQGENS
jgi:hypothetical protein